MENVNEVIAGLLILAPYYDKQESRNIGAEHDIIYSYATDRPVPEDVYISLYKLGWFQVDVDADEDDGIPPYDPESSWGYHV